MSAQDAVEYGLIDKVLDPRERRPEIGCRQICLRLIAA